jgi:hypothetical protein
MEMEMFAHIPNALDLLRGECRDDEDRQLLSMLGLVAAPLLCEVVMCGRRRKTRTKAGQRSLPPAERVLLAAARNGRGELLSEIADGLVFTRQQREMMGQDRGVAAALEDIFRIVRDSAKAVEIGLVQQMRRRHSARAVYVADQISQMLARRFGSPYDALAADITNVMLGLDGRRAVTREVPRWARRAIPHWRQPRDWMSAFCSPARRVVGICSG